MFHQCEISDGRTRDDERIASSLLWDIFRGGRVEIGENWVVRVHRHCPFGLFGDEQEVIGEFIRGKRFILRSQ